MDYVSLPFEKNNFKDSQFDVISSFNNLDHVDDINITIKEIKRCLKIGGHFLLITDVGHDPTPM
jgi:ubiquinone/menaquinone biosynthesis C-methylase UbiE